MIRVRDLRVDYDGVCAVRDLSLSVDPGEVCGLIGPNGAGKTTTMRAMLGLLEPTYGEIELAGIDVREHPREACRVVGFMPDFPPMYEDLLCWEFLDVFAAGYFVPRSERRYVVDQALDLVGLGEKRHALVVELSRGMRQRLMLAKTLIPDPQVLLLDEPASGMDPQGRIDLKNILKELGSQGKTVLVSSHILAEMSEFCTAVAIMEKGRMVVNGTIDDVRARVIGSTVYDLEFLDSQDVLLRVLTEEPLVTGVEMRDGGCSFRFSGGAEDASRLLAVFVSSGVRLVTFARRKEGLEEVFLKVGARELA